MVSEWEYRRWRLPLLAGVIPIAALAVISFEELGFAGFDHPDPLWLAVLIATLAAGVVDLAWLARLRSTSRGSARTEGAATRGK